MPAPKTQFLTNDALTRKRWARDLFKVMLPEIEFNYLIGTSVDSPVQMRTELGKGEGDTIKFGIRKPLIGEGIVGNEKIEGTEEKLRFADFSVTIEERGHSVDTGGKMEEQRVPYDLMKEGRDALQEWWSDWLSDLVINTLCSNTNYKIKGSFFGNTILAPDTKHHMLVNSGTAGSLTSADTIDLGFLDSVKQRAELMNAEGDNHWKIRPLKLGGKNFYRLIMHNYVFDALRQNINVGQWGDLLRSANKLQLPEVEIEYNGLLISKSERCPQMVADTTDTRAGEYRSVLLGAQAACFAWGGAGETKSSTMSFHPYTHDADRFVMIRGNGILGCKKTRFDSVDYGAIVTTSWGAPLA